MNIVPENTRYKNQDKITAKNTLTKITIFFIFILPRY